MMNLFAMSRSMARLEYTAVRLPLTLLDERIVSRYWHDQGLSRLGFQRFLGSIDELAGWLLADDDISRRGQALTRRTWHLAVADEPGSGLQGGCRERVERADGVGEGEDLAVHQALVELVQVEQLRLLRVAGLQQVGGRGAQRDGAEPGRVQR